MTVDDLNANNLNPDEAPQNVGLHLRSKFIWHSDHISAKKLVETMNFLKILKETNIWKNYPACNELSRAADYDAYIFLKVSLRLIQKLYNDHSLQLRIKIVRIWKRHNKIDALIFISPMAYNYIFLVSNSKVRSHLNTTWRCDFTVIICMYLVNIWKCLIWQLCRVYPDAMTRCAQLITVSWIHNVTLQQ